MYMGDYSLQGSKPKVKIEPQDASRRRKLNFNMFGLVTECLPEIVSRATGSSNEEWQR